MESVDHLLKRVARLGIKRDYLQRVLPDWVESYPPTSPTGLTELKIQLARDLGLDLQSLAETRDVTFREPPSPPKFKRTKRQEPGKLAPATSMFSALARTLISACDKPYQPVPADPRVVRKEILAGGSLVTLPALLDYMWGHGIPVAHYSDWPDKLPRPLAMVIDVDGRPAVIVGSPRKENAWQMFFVAHELGHIASGHVGRNEVLVDADEDVTGEGADEQEIEADGYALVLLGGSKDVRLPPAGTKFDALQKAARDLARAQKIDIGHLLLRFAMQTHAWQEAQYVLGQTEVGADAPALINRDRVADAVSLDQLSGQRQEFVRRVLALD